MDETSDGGAQRPLGPFEIHAPWRGGGGRLFVGAHGAAGTPVLIQGLGPLGDPAGRVHLWSRLARLARLDQPGFSAPLYFGQEGSEGGALLSPGEPFVVLPYPDLGTLLAGGGALPWRACRAALFQILDALAGLHGRGVALGGFGPEAVFLGEIDEGRVLISLAPLALARALDPDAPSPTPAEDLASLARVAAFMAWGDTLPAGGERTRVLPPGYPSGFAGWLLLLGQGGALSPLMTAAGLARGLAALGEPGEATARGLRPGQTLRVQLSDWYESLSREPTAAPAPADEEGGEEEPFIAWLEEDPPRLSHLDPRLVQEGWDPEDPAPVNWRGGPGPLPTDGQRLQLLAPLAGLRAEPLCQRQPERDALWRALLGVLSSGRAQGIALHGDEGVGLSSLAAWLCERAHGLLGASCLRTLHTPTDADSLPLGEMLRAHLGLTEAARASVPGALARYGVEDPFELAAFEALCLGVAPTSPEGLLSDRAPAFRAPQERYALLERHIRRLTRVAPVIVWLDDAQWGRDSLGFAHHVLRAQRVRPAPILFVITAQRGALARRPLEQEALEALEREEGVEALDISPLTAGDLGAMARDALHLEGRLAALVVKGAEGAPLRAREQVVDWLARGCLAQSERGYALAPGDPPPQAPGADALWRRRALSTGPLGGRALELGAALGRRVSRVTFLEALAAADLPRGDTLCLDLLRQGLLRPEGAGGSFSFAHGGIWRVSGADARAAGRALEDHRLLSALPSMAGAPEARARQHLAGGEPALGADALLQAAEARRRLGELKGARALLRAWRQVMERAPDAMERESFGVGLILEGRLALQGEDLAGARRAAEEADRGARTHGWERVGAHALVLLAELEGRDGRPGRAALLAKRGLKAFEGLRDRHGAGRCQMVLANADWERGDLESAASYFRRAEGLFRQEGDILRQASCILALGSAARVAQDRDKAKRRYKDALALFEEARDQTGRAQSLEAMGMMAKDEGDFPRARTFFKQAALVYGRVGQSRGVANGLNHLAEVSRAKGSLRAAEAGYRRSIQIYESLGLAESQGILPRMNLALLQLRRGRYGEGRGLLEGCLGDLRTRGRSLHQSAMHGGLTLAAAGLEDWDGFDRHLEMVERALAGKGHVLDADDGWPLQQAGELAAAAGERSRARRALRAALLAWRAMDDSEGMEGARRALDAISHVDITGVGIPAYRASEAGAGGEGEEEGEEEGEA